MNVSINRLFDRTQQVTRPTTKRFHMSHWRALEACCRPWTWWCKDATPLAGYATKMTMTMMLLFWILVYILATTLVSLNVCMYLSEHWSRARDVNGWDMTKTLTVFIKTRRDVDMSWSSPDHNLKTRGFVSMCMFFLDKWLVLTDR